MISLLITLAVAVIVIGLIYWIVTQIPLPPPVAKIVNIAIVVIAALVVIMILLKLGNVVALP